MLLSVRIRWWFMNANVTGHAEVPHPQSFPAFGLFAHQKRPHGTWATPETMLKRLLGYSTALLYPSALAGMLCRRVWVGTLEELCRDPGVNFTPVFVKPRRCKRFTGRVTDSLADLWAVPQISGQDEFLCAEVITWIAEYRSYVLYSKILGTHCYTGMPAVNRRWKALAQYTTNISQ